MRVRHKIPSIFNLSMVDVLCCALGCVILLWLMNLKIAKEHEGRSAQDKQDVDGANKALEVRLAASESGRRTAEQERDRARLEARNLDERLKKLLEEQGLLEREIKERDQKIDDLLAKLKTADVEIGKHLATIKAAEETQDKMLALLKAANLEIEKRSKETADTKRERDEFRERMDGSDNLLKKLVAEKARLEKELADGRKRIDELRSAGGAADAVAKELRTNLGSAERERDELAAKLRGLDSKSTDTASTLERVRAELETLRRDADNRFAGIELTGKRVIFLVDMSGSMGYVREDTPAPLKWTGVRETVLKIMRSLPNLKQYQLIVFSDKEPIFLLGKPREWLTYDFRTSPQQVSDALEKLKPEGGTNMYDAFKTAFEYRKSELDTIYFFSDGLPNVGEGLTPREATTLNDVQKGEKLGKYILKKLADEWNVAVGGKRPVKINAIGFFFESPDLGAFLWTLSRANEGGFVGMSKP